MNDIDKVALEILMSFVLGVVWERWQRRPTLAVSGGYRDPGCATVRITVQNRRRWRKVSLNAIGLEVGTESHVLNHYPGLPVTPLVIPGGQTVEGEIDSWKLAEILERVDNIKLHTGVYLHIWARTPDRRYHWAPDDFTW